MILLAEIESILLEAGAIARRYFGASDAMLGRATKSNNTPVSRADLEIASLLRGRLLQLAPNAHWRCEEHDENDQTSSDGLFWVVDPLDGTKELVRGIPEIGISIALVAEGRPVLAAVANPLTNEAGYWSEREGLRFAPEAASMSPSPLGTLADAIASASRSEYEKGSLKPFDRGMKAVRPIGSVAYKLLRVAAGEEQLYFSVEPKSEWDICGGAALIWEAEMEYLRFDGVPITFGAINSRVKSEAIAGPANLVEEFTRTYRTAIDECQSKIKQGIVS